VGATYRDHTLSMAYRRFEQSELEGISIRDRGIVGDRAIAIAYPHWYTAVLSGLSRMVIARVIWKFCEIDRKTPLSFIHVIFGRYSSYGTLQVK
jgi:hypothetical protein